MVQGLKPFQRLGFKVWPGTGLGVGRMGASYFLLGLQCLVQWFLLHEI